MNHDELFGGSDSSDNNDRKPPAPADNSKNSQNQKRKASTNHENHQQDVAQRKQPRVVLPEYDDKEKALVAVNQNGCWLRNRSDRLRDDEEIVLAAIRQDPTALQFASPRLKNHPQIVMEAISSKKYARTATIQYASPDLLLKDKKFVLSLIDVNPGCFRYLPVRSLKDDKDIVLAAIQKSTHQVAYASERLRSDRDVVLAAASNSWLELMLRHKFSSYQWVSRDREIMLKAVRSKGLLLQFASPEIRADREVVWAAVESGKIGAPGFVIGSQGWLGDVLNEELLADRALNLLAAQRCGCFLNAELCKQDREIALAGVSKNAGLFTKLSESLQADREIALAALRSNQDIYSDLPMNLKRDYELAMIAVSKGGYDQFSAMPEELRGDRNLLLAALEGYERGEEYNYDLVTTPPDWFESASVELRSDTEIILKAVSRNGLFLRDVVLNGTRDVDIVKRAVECDPIAFQYGSTEANSNPDVAAEVLRAVLERDDIEELDLTFFREHVGESLWEKLAAIYHECELGDCNSDKVDLCEHKDVTQWSRKWKKPLWHKVWLLDKMVPNDAKVKILQFTDILPDFRLARKIVDVGPVVEVLAAKDMGVDDLLKPEEDSSESE